MRLIPGRGRAGAHGCVARGSQGLGPVNILLIDDDYEAAELVSDLLRRTWTAEVSIASTAGEAQRMIEASAIDGGERFDLIVMDIGLPDFDGIELCRRVRKMPTLALVPIVMVSGYCGEQQIEAALEAGATDYVCKPVRSRELVARIRVALREKSVREHERHVTHELEVAAEDLKRTNATLERLSAVDPLTQLPNRRQFNAVLQREWRRAARGAGPLAVVMVDIDHFHAYNERYGHLAGDECLIKVAAALAAVIHRPTDLVARWGGEEFIYVLAETDLEGAALIGEKVRAAIEALAIPHASSDASQVVTVSVGVASTRPSLERSPEELLAMADEALYKAKGGGRNRVSEGSGGETRGGETRGSESRGGSSRRAAVSTGIPEMIAAGEEANTGRWERVRTNRSYLRLVSEPALRR